MTDEIRTARLLLRRARAEDIDPMHAILSNREATRYWSTLPFTELAQTEEWMAPMLDPSEGSGDEFVIVADGRMIGKIGCWQPPEIGFILEPATWGSGYAGEALAAFIDHRRARGAQEITADVDPRNAAALALLVKAGFVETGRAERTFKLGDEWCDSVYLRLDLQPLS
ncbi:MAG TPA: GNAT family N-acetyltransferase [Sphingomicrobium sp.]|nr:GNAT family N-acetyltransferase [Sphingomicrobium sp.]